MFGMIDQRLPDNSNHANAAIIHGTMAPLCLDVELSLGCLCACDSNDAEE